MAPQALTRQMLKNSKEESGDSSVVETQDTHAEIIKSPPYSPSYIGSFVKSLVHRRPPRPLKADFSDIEVRVTVLISVVLTLENPSLFKL